MSYSIRRAYKALTIWVAVLVVGFQARCICLTMYCKLHTMGKMADRLTDPVDRSRAYEIYNDKVAQFYRVITYRSVRCLPTLKARVIDAIKERM